MATMRTMIKTGLFKDPEFIATLVRKLERAPTLRSFPGADQP